MTHENGNWMNDDQRGGHDQAGAAYGALKGILTRGETSERSLKWLEDLWSEIERLRDEREKLCQ